ncbi:MAG: 3,4-dihydroxy-2-butanone 4-phosphate synthase / GTP cyclohydrolase II, partial [uncultured Nocardioides sp.]
ERAPRHRRAGRRRHRRRQGGDRRRRRGPRERGRHHLRRLEGDARADGVHHPALQRRHLRADARGHARAARDPADDPAQQGPAAHGVHHLRRRARRRLDRDQRGRPCPHRPASRRLGDRAVGPHPSGTRVPPPLPRGRGAGPPGAHRGRGRPRPTRRPHPGRRPGRGRQRRRHDEARPRAAGVRRRARAGDDLDRGPGALPAPPRAARRAGRRDPAADRPRRLHGVRLPHHDRRQRARRAGPRRHLRGRAGPDPRALRVPHRRHLRQPPLRLRPPAAGGDGAHRRRGARGGRLPPRPRGARDRARRQAPGLPAAGRRPRHGRRQPRPRTARRRPPLRHRHPGAARPRRRERPAAHEQPRQDRQPRGLRDPRRGAAAHRDAPPRRQPGLPRDQAAPDGSRPAGPERPRPRHHHRGAAPV